MLNSRDVVKVARGLSAASAAALASRYPEDETFLEDARRESGVERDPAWQEIDRAIIVAIDLAANDADQAHDPRASDLPDDMWRCNRLLRGAALAIYADDRIGAGRRRALLEPLQGWLSSMPPGA